MRLIGKAVDRWQRLTDRWLLEANDEVRIYLPPQVSESGGPNVDSFFGESTDGRNPTGLQPSEGEVTYPDPISVRGRLRRDLYGRSIARREEVQPSEIGEFMPGDALFTCKLSDVLRGTDDQGGGTTYVGNDEYGDAMYGAEIDAEFARGTWFDNCAYVYVPVWNEKFNVIHVGYRGLIRPYICDVFLRKANE